MELVTADKVENAICTEVTKEEAEELSDIGYEMIDLCEKEDGVGLAAPQVGINKKMLIKRDLFTKNYEVIFNPSFYRDGSTTRTIEGCLTYPGEYYHLKRFKRVGVIYYLLGSDGLFKMTKKATGMEAFMWQHEIMHLMGRTIAMDGEHIDEDKIKKRIDREGKEFKVPKL